MNEFTFKPRTLLRFHEGPLGFCIDSYLALLKEQGYARHSAGLQLRLIADFSRWLDKKGCGAQEITHEKVNRYLRFRHRTHHPQRSDHAAFDRLIVLMRQMGVIPGKSTPTISFARDHLLEEFRGYLLDEKALSPATLQIYLPFARQFLCECFTVNRIVLSQLCMSHVIGFVERHIPTLSRTRAQLMTTALRSFLGYLRYHGELSTDLAACVPSVARWSLSELPKFLEPGDVQRVLDHCNRQTAVGMRDYAILLLLARLGLRSSEVALLNLEDINWDAGQITIYGKGGRSDQLPLPVDVGESIAIYLQKARPSCSSRAVFVRVRAPQRGLGEVRSIVRPALLRAGVNSPTQRKGAHLFRHSLATQMLRHGASLSEIGEILRHRHPNTTMIYAKVDLTALRTLALPWPGGAL